MIPRILVPEGARLPAAADTTTQRRRPTTLDERTLVPAMLPIIELDGKSSIPRSLPLESIAARVVVPRDVNQEAYNVKENPSTPVQPTDMDERIAIPQGGAPLEITQGRLIPPADIVDLDVFMTGEVNLLTKPQTEEKNKWDLITRVSSFAFHILLFATIILWARIFPPHVPTKDEIDLANRQLTWIPPESSYAPKPKAEPRPAAPPPAVHVDPRVINKVAPPAPQPPPRPVPETPKRELPDAPAPKVQAYSASGRSSRSQAGRSEAAAETRYSGHAKAAARAGVAEGSHTRKYGGRLVQSAEFELACDRRRGPRFGAAAVLAGVEAAEQPTAGSRCSRRIRGWTLTAIFSVCTSR